MEYPIIESRREKNPFKLHGSFILFSSPQRYLQTIQTMLNNRAVGQWNKRGTSPFCQASLREKQEAK